MRALAAGLCVLALSAPARALPLPCDDCAFEPAGVPGPAPLLVVLHGDNEPPAATLVPWRVAAAAHHVALFAPRCPKEDGCKGSFWQWNGDPSWVDRKVVALAEKTPIDPRRVGLAGWSGGATYIGMRFPDLSDRWASILIVGGGMAPARDAPCRSVPVLMLEGDKNPYHHLALALFHALDACKTAELRVIPGADHGAERRALAKRADELLAFFDQHPKPPPPAPAPAPIPEPEPEPEPVPMPPPATPPRAGCACRTSDPAPITRAPAPGLAVVLALALARRRRPQPCPL